MLLAQCGRLQLPEEPLGIAASSGHRQHDIIRRPTMSRLSLNNLAGWQRRQGRLIQCALTGGPHSPTKHLAGPSLRPSYHGVANSLFTEQRLRI